MYMEWCRVNVVFLIIVFLTMRFICRSQQRCPLYYRLHHQGYITPFLHLFLCHLQLLSSFLLISTKEFPTRSHSQYFFLQEIKISCPSQNILGQIYFAIMNKDSLANISASLMKFRLYFKGESVTLGYCFESIPLHHP